jgi:hypothetical protein
MDQAEPCDMPAQAAASPFGLLEFAGAEDNPEELS